VTYYGWGISIAALVGVAAPNGLVSAFAVVVGVLLIGMLTRTGEPQVLLYAVLYQWLQAAAALLYADLRGERLVDVYGSESMLVATWLTLFGVLAFGAGIWLTAGRATKSTSPIAAEFAPLSIRNLFIAWLIAFPVVPLLALAGGVLPSIRQLLLSIAQLKWVIVFIFAATVFRQGRGYQMLAVVIAMEALYGVLGYFAEFKTIFLFVGLAAVFALERLTGKRIVVMAVTVVVLIVLATVWTAVKDDYRRFSNQGTKQQTVEVSPTEQLSMLVELVDSQSTESLADAVERLIERVAYVQIFSWVIDYVPAIVPHQNGALWLGAIRHITSPRVLDPEKPALDDSAETAEYTGLAIAGTSEGTSIGLGYIAESYVDFGSTLMLLPIFAMGVLVGGTYRILARRESLRLLGMACATVLVALGANLVETSNAKMLGGLVTSFIVFYGFLRFFGPRFIYIISRLK
jgi:hypothetical protein